MTAVLDEKDIEIIARSVADEVLRRLGSPQKYIRTKKIPEVYDVSRSYAEKLVKDMRESGRFDYAFIKDDRVILVERQSLERFWRERGEK